MTSRRIILGNTALLGGYNMGSWVGIYPTSILNLSSVFLFYVSFRQGRAERMSKQQHEPRFRCPLEQSTSGIRAFRYREGQGSDRYLTNRASHVTKRYDQRSYELRACRYKELAKCAQAARIDITESENKRLERMSDRRVLSIMILMYFL